MISSLSVASSAGDGVTDSAMFNVYSFVAEPFSTFIMTLETDDVYSFVFDSSNTELK